MMNIKFNVINAGIIEKNIFDYSDFSKNGPCDMCWGDLSF